MKIDNREKLKDISILDYRLLKKIYRFGRQNNLTTIKTEEFYRLFSENLSKSGLIEEEKQDLAVKATSFFSSDSNKFSKRFTIVSHAQRGETVKRVLELEIMEAKNFIKNFAVNDEINLLLMKKYFETLKLKKHRSGPAKKKYPHLLEIVHLEKATAVISQAKNRPNN